MKPAKTYSEDLVKCIRESEKTNLQGKVSLKPCTKPQISNTKYEIKNDTDKVTFSIQKPTNKFMKSFSRNGCLVCLALFYWRSHWKNFDVFASRQKIFQCNLRFHVCQFLMGISIIAFSLVNDITYFMIVTSCFGFGEGFSFSSFITVMIEVMGIEMLPAVLGVSSLFKGLAGIIF
ncbi:hypothetical protein Avbf_10176 [Armadillidium vulgare]|nr:hypothetical protein Avbf_10176 [Armadillidium vulgare]